MRAGRVADLDAVQLGGCAGSGRYTGQRRLMTRSDHREMHDVFIVISPDNYGEHVARTVYAASEDDARQAHQANYADEPIVALRWPAQGHVMERPTTEAEWKRWAKWKSRWNIL